ncbi:MAG: tetratricopeptide repeat protein [Calditrichia bacterium]
MARKQRRQNSHSHTLKPSAGRQSPMVQTAMEYHRSGHLDQALIIYEQAYSVDPENAEINYLLAVLNNQMQNFDRAHKYIDKAISINRRSGAFYCALAETYRLQQDFLPAITALKKAISLENHSVEPHIMLGMIYKSMDRLDDAVNAYQAALVINPDIAEIHNNLGNAYRNKNDIERTIKAYKKAIAINDRFAGAHHNLGCYLLETGNPDDALSFLRNASQLQAENSLFTADLANCLGQVVVTETDGRLKDDLIRCMQLDRVDGGTLAKSINVFLKQFTPLGKLHNEIEKGIFNPLLPETYQILVDPLFLLYLEREQVCDPELEKVLSNTRKIILEMSVLEGHEIGSNIERFLSALAHQCFLNEYIYSESESERLNLKILEERIQKNSQVNPEQLCLILVYACYRPLYTLHLDISLMDLVSSSAKASSRKVFKRQINEPLVENELKQNIKQLTNISGETSSIVQAQYEQNPYPRWLYCDHPETMTLNDYLHSLFSVSERKNYDLPDRVNILVAGCGTGLQPIRDARRFLHENITAIDLSVNSLAYAKRKATEMGLENIDFMQADIMNLKDYKNRFDFIESFGVLHHLKDPLVGWKVLCSLLKKNGVIRLGLYSEHARKAIVATRRYIQQQGFTDNIEGIRLCRQAIFALPEHDPVRSVTDSPDFYSVSECRDLIFHVNEHRLTLVQVADYIKQLDLEFLGFEFPDFHTVRKYQESYPEDNQALNLELWDAYERTNPETFASQYVFWCKKIED